MIKLYLVLLAFLSSLVLPLGLPVAARLPARSADEVNFQSAPGNRSPSHTHDQAVQTRGDQVMGFAHEKTIHHFLLFPDGGEIVVSANDPADTTSIAQIRTHLSHIAKMFAGGNFRAPMLIHDTNPPGTSTLARLKEQIHYTYTETAAGASIRITASAATIDAVHAFLLFQILDHHTGDSAGITPTPSP